MNLSPFTTFTEELVGECEERLAQAARMCTFGISYLDDALYGILPNDLIVLAGRSGGGKSEIAIHISMINALKGKRVFHLALEAEKREMTRRALFKALARDFYSRRAFVSERPNYLAWLTGRQEHLFEKYGAEITSQLAKFENLKLFYRGTDFGTKELSMIFSSVKNQADLLVLDHLHYVDIPDDNENKAYKEMVKEIRNLALYYGIPVILVAHIRKADRKNPNPVPDLEDIHGSSDIFKIATKVITIAPARELRLDPHRFPTFLKIAKCRQDGSLQFVTGLSVFDLSRGEYEETYKLGNHNYKGEWELIEVHPHWARRAK